ncbi:MAG: nickel-responsive transcriptional regulator NikR [Limnochordia bacterium]|jgi:CopG family nickel-responsive transcriptional regulator|nr:nickel-responsive transcriptional regulator NikR [Limnochordia bacterium]
MEGELSRFGVSVDSNLLTKFDQLITNQGYTNRSEAIRDMMRDYLADHAKEENGVMIVGTLTLLYDHHVRELSDRLTDLQHHYHQNIISTLHVHLDQSLCLEVLILKGKNQDIEKIAGKLISTRGVKYGKLTSTSLHVF